MTELVAAYSSVSEPGGEDFSANTSTAGRVAVGGSATGEIGASRDRDWFAVELVAGRTYTIDLKGGDTDDGELIDPYLRGIHNADGKRISDTKDDDGGVLRNSQLTFVATQSGTHYIAAGAHTTYEGTYTVEVTDNSPPEAQQQVVQEPPAFGAQAYGFNLAENADGTAENAEGSTAWVALGAVSATDPEGAALSYSLEGGNGSGLFEIGAASGVLFYTGTGEDFEAGTGPFELTVRASAGAHSADTTVTVSVTDVQEAPAFGARAYLLGLAENTDGSTARVLLGTVSATDPEGAALSYSLEGGNGSGLFEIDAASGELFYTGTGEDYEAGTTSFELTVRASDGDLSADITVTVSVIDVAEAPAFARQGYAFDLTENADGSTSRVSLGTVLAVDPEGAALSYSLEGGNGSGLFEIDGASGELFYVGTGEDYEAGTAPFDLTVRASDGELSEDAAVTVTVTDVLETATQLVQQPPAFGAQGYAFELAENADGSANRVSLGTVSAMDPEGAALSYSLEGGNGSGLFEIDAASGELFYTGAGEDYEAGTGPFELTVRANDGDLFTDTTVTVGVTDVQEAPAFARQGYAFELAENTDGSTARVSLGTVSAVDPEGAALGYSLEGSNGSGRFEIDAASGELFYTGTGEDFESGATSFELTVRASDGTHAVDTTVTVSVTDMQEDPTVDPHVSESQESVSEPDGEDFSANTSTAGRIAVGDSVTGNIGSSGDRDWYAVELVAGVEYRIDLEGSETGVGTLADPLLRWLHDSGGAGIRGTRNDDGGQGDNARQEFTPTESGTYYISANGKGSGTGTYRLSVTQVSPPAQEAPAFAEPSYAFALAENADGSTARVSLGTVSVMDPEGAALSYSLEGGNGSGLFEIDAASGELFYTGTGEDFESGTGPFELTVRAGDGNIFADTTVTVSVADVPEAPAFAEQGHAFELAENTDGSTTRVSLGTVSAVDPEGAALSYSLEGGNGSGLFEIDAASGELFYTGAGEDFEAGTGPFELTVRGSDGDLFSDITVTVTVADMQEAPAFAEQGYEFELAENADGSTARVSLGTVSAVDPEGAALSYSIEGGNGSGLFEIGAASGELFYTGTGEDFEAGTGPFELTVRASDGDLFSDITVTVTVADMQEAPAFAEQGYAFGLAENTDGSTSRVSLGTVAAADPEGAALGYSIEGGNASGRFEIDSGSGELFYVGAGEDFEAGTGPFELTVRASDGDRFTDTTVTVTVADVQEVPAVRVADAEATEGDDAVIVFRVTLDGASTSAVRVNYATADGTATAGDDYEAVQGTLTFAPGETEKTVSVTVIDDNVEDSGETFRLLLSSPDGATLADSEATGTLLNIESWDDFAAGTSTTGTVVVGGSTTGGIDMTDNDKADKDWFAVELEAGQLYQFDLKGRSTWHGTLPDPVIEAIYDSDRNKMPYTYDDDSGEKRNARAWFRPTDGGTYFIEAGSDRSWGSPGTGTYRLYVEESTLEDDHYPTEGNSISTVAIGGSITGTIERPGDRDWFAANLTAGQLYQFDLESGEGPGALADPDLHGIWRHENGGASLIPNTANSDIDYKDAGYNARVWFTPDTDGLYSVSAGAWWNETGSYKLSVKAVTDDPPAGTSTTDTVPVDGSVRGALEVWHDRDWYEVTLEADHIYRFKIRGVSVDGEILDTPSMDGIYTSDGTLIAGTGDDDCYGLQNARTWFRPDTAGTYYVQVALGGYSGGDVGGYELSVEDLTDDHPSDTSTTHTIDVNGSVTGSIEGPGDEDWYSVTLKEGERYRVDLEGSPTNRGTLGNPYLRGVYDSDGNLVAGTEDDNGGAGNNARTFFTAAVDEDDEDGGESTYYLSAGSAGTHTGSYRLKLTEVTDDHTADTMTTGTVSLSGDIGSARGMIDWWGDADWYAVTLEQGVPYRIELEGSWTNRGTLGDAYLGGIYDTNGELISGTGDDNSGSYYNALVFFTPDAAGTYYISAGAGEKHLGTYRLTVEDLSDEPSADTGTVGEVAVGGSAQGGIGWRGDRDWYAVELTADKKYMVEIKGSSSNQGTLSDPQLRGIYDSSGNFISGTSNDDSGYLLDAREFFTPDADGTYYLSASAEREDSHNGKANTYRLFVRDVTDDLAANKNTAGTITVGGSVTGEIGWTKDRDWYAVELEAAETYRINLKADSTGHGTLLDPTLRGIHDSNGHRIRGTSNDDGGAGSNSRLTFSPDTDGTYYISAGAWSDFFVGSYTLFIDEL